MKVLVLASSRHGTATHHLQVLIQNKACEVVLVVLNEGHVVDRAKQLKRKFRKVLRIGPLGALNGVRMRNWFRPDIQGAKGLEEICAEHGIPFRSTPNINSEATRQLFREADADVGLSLGNGYIGKSVFSIPRLGMINVHHELLPDYQNAQSIIWQVHNMSPVTGYTIHKIDTHIDTGDVLFRETVPIEFQRTLRRTVGKTWATLQEASAMGLLKVLRDFDDMSRNARPQGKGHSYTTPTIRQFITMVKNHGKLRDAAKADHHH